MKTNLTLTNQPVQSVALQLTPENIHQKSKMAQERTLWQQFATAMVYFLVATVMLLLSMGRVTAQIALRGSATTASSTNTNLTINKPTGVTTGDIMLVNIVKANNSGTNPSLSGWTLLSGGVINGASIRGAVLYKVATGSEPSSYTFALGTGVNSAAANLVAFSGVNTSTPFDVTPPSISLSTANGGTISATGSTTVTPGAAIVLFGQGSDNNTWSNWTTTVPGSLTEISELSYNNPNTGSDDLTAGVAWGTKTSTGATGTGNATMSATNDRWGALMVALRPCVAITTQPSAPTAVCAGAGSRTISVTATGSGTLTYSWRKNGTAVSNGAVFSGQGTSTLTITNPSTSDAGSYTVVVSNSCSSITSSAVTVTVNPVPTAVSATPSTTTVCTGNTLDLTGAATPNSNTTVTILSENFNAGTNSWTKTNNSTGGTVANAAWTLRANGYSYNDGTNNNVFNSNDNSQFYLSNSDDQGSGGTTATLLQSPAFSTVGYSSASVSFYHHYRFNSGAESAKLEVSTNGTTWTTLTTYSSTQGTSGGFVQATASLASYLNQATVYIRFKYYATFDWYWAIDNVAITGVSTTDPATYSWTSTPAGFSSSLQSPTGVTPASSGIIYTLKVTNSYGCETSASSSAITLKAVTQITSQPAPSTQTVQQYGVPSNISVSATGDNLSYQWYVNATNSNSGGTTLGASNGAQTATYTPGAVTEGTQYYYCIVTGDCGAVTSSVAAVTISNTNVWTGAVNNDFSNASNWSLGVVPASTTNATVNSGTATLSATAAINNLSIASGATVSINGQTLTVNGAVTGAGTITGSHTSSLVITGAAGTLNFTQTGAGNYLKNFTLNNGATATLGNQLNITGGLSAGNEGTLTVTGTATLTSAGNLVIKSNEFGTARIAPGRTTGGYITGDVTVERHIPMNSSKAWRLLGTATSGSQSINAAWQEGVVGTNNNPNPGFGTMIPARSFSFGQNLSSAQAAGFDTLALNYSLYRYDAATDNIIGISNTLTKSLSSETGYFLFVRGDRSGVQAGTAAPSTSTVLRSKGNLFLGDQTAISVSAGGWQLARNPFPSRIDMRQIARTGGAVNAYQIWDPKLGGSFGVGAYQTFTFNGSNYEVSPGGGSYGANGSVNNFIESGAAFYLQATGSAGTFQVVEAAKASGSTNAYREGTTTSTNGKLVFSVFAINSPTSTNLVDGGLVYFNSDYSDIVDVEDVRKSPNFKENFGIIKNGAELVVEKRNLIQANDTVKFTMYQMQNLTYTLELGFQNLDLGGNSAFLYDKFLNTYTLIDPVNSTRYNFTITAVAASKATDRFSVVFRPQAPLPVTFQQVKAFRSGNNVQVAWEVSNQMNLRSYVVEKSTDGRNFTAVNTQDARNVQLATVTYQWLDEQAAAVNFYRIRSVDISGTTQVSAVVKVQMNKQGAISVYPNPVRGNSMQVQLSNQPAGTYQVKLVNLQGQAVLLQSVNHSGGNAAISISVPGQITNGIYQVEITGADASKNTQSLLVDRSN